MTDTPEQLALLLGQRLKAAGWMLATAESCTGGGIASAITSVSGSSTWFDRGFVTYSNQAKQDMLGVSEATLSTHGAVSEPVAREMAEGALRKSRACLAVSVTGIAGPDGGTPAKPVGTVCIAWSAPDSGTTSSTFHFKGDREQVRRQSIIAAIEGLIRLTGER